jgi:hypothetical protein
MVPTLTNESLQKVNPIGLDTSNTQHLEIRKIV